MSYLSSTLNRSGNPAVQRSLCQNTLFCRFVCALFVFASVGFDVQAVVSQEDERESATAKNDEASGNLEAKSEILGEPEFPTIETDNPGLGLKEEVLDPVPRRPAKPLPLQPAPIPRKPENVEQMLRYFDVDESLLRQLIDRRPLHVNEGEAIVRVLFALPKLPAEMLDEWTEDTPDWNAFNESPEEYRTKIYGLEGRVTRVERVEIIAEAARRFGFSYYYRADVEVGEDCWKATVCARKIPKAWKLGETINEACSFRGLFLKLGDGPVFAANRIAWHPNRLDPETGIGRSQVFLGDLSMDVGLWDNVRDKQPLVSRDREAFYQLLAAMGRTRQDHMRAKSSDDFEFADMLRQPGEFHGRLISLEGTARRCAKIIVSDPDIQARFGIDHYYEIYVFVQLEKVIVYKDPKSGKSVEFNSFPVAVCVRELPRGMPEGDGISAAVRISGVFFKLWAYESAKMTSFEAGKNQLSPMLVALKPDLLQSNQAPNPYFGITVGGLFIVALLGVWVGVWRFGREDAQFKRETLSRQYELAEGKSLDDMGLNAQEEPDFSHLK